jgi:ribosomal protein S4E
MIVERKKYFKVRDVVTVRFVDGTLFEGEIVKSEIFRGGDQVVTVENDRGRRVKTSAKFCFRITP